MEYFILGSRMEGKLVVRLLVAFLILPDVKVASKSGLTLGLQPH